MPERMRVVERRTSADAVFDNLLEQISTLKLMPGTKISEAEVAAKFGVSRQPVRDAFSRLANMNLLLIRPQKATEIRKFSMRGIKAARFIRMSIELEVLRQAASVWDGSHDDALDANLGAQSAAASAGDVDEFHALDYAYHQLLSKAADAEFAFAMIQRQKAQVDRLCILSLSSEYGMDELADDHMQIVQHVRNKDSDAATTTMRMHLSRLDAVIDTVRREHQAYFED